MSGRIDAISAFLDVESAVEGYVNTMGLKTEHIEEGKVVMSMLVKQNTVNIYGIIHGGALAGLLDTCMGLTCFTLGKQVVTLDMQVNYIKSAKLGEKLTATSTVLHAGESTIMLEALVVNENNEVVSKGSANFFVVGQARL